jgi:regulatory protein
MAGTITALIAQKRNRERVNVYLDGEFAFGLAASAAIGLHKGQTLSDEEIAQLRALDQAEKAHQRALNFLSYRPRSVAEVQRNLREKDVPEEIIEQEIKRLERVGLLDDEAFARYWIARRVASEGCIRGYHRGRIGRLQRRRGGISRGAGTCVALCQSG